MPPQGKSKYKDTWDKFHIGAQVLIALVALLFTVLFGFRQQKNAEATLELTASNVELAKAQATASDVQLELAKKQAQSALLESLSSDNPKQRDMALYLAKAIDESFAAAIASVLALNDPDQEVRKSARSTLRSLSQSGQEQVKQKAEKGLDQSDVMNELQTKGLLKKLNDAQGYLDGGNEVDKERAIRLYREVLNQLSPEARKKLDQALLSEAEKDYRNGHNDDAGLKYRALFANYR